RVEGEAALGAGGLVALERGDGGVAELVEGDADDHGDQEGHEELRFVPEQEQRRAQCVSLVRTGGFGAGQRRSAATLARAAPLHAPPRGGVGATGPTRVPRGRLRSGEVQGQAPTTSWTSGGGSVGWSLQRRAASRPSVAERAASSSLARMGPMGGPGAT